MTKEERDRIKELLGAGTKKGVEIRTQTVELRVNRAEDGALPKIEGYASVFNKDSEDMGFIERVAPGAFTKALKISDARALFNHDANYILGRQSAGTLELKEDKTGLFMSVDPPDTQLIRDMVLTPIERGDIKEQSFGFTIAADEWAGLDSDHPTRTITEVREIYDVSPVVYPAYQDTTVALRSLAAAKEVFEAENEQFKPIVVLVVDDEDLEIKTEADMLRFKELLIDFRSSLNPTIPDDDDNPENPTVDPPEIMTGNDELLIRIRETEQRFKEGE